MSDEKQKWQAWQPKRIETKANPHILRTEIKSVGLAGLSKRSSQNQQRCLFGSETPRQKAQNIASLKKMEKLRFSQAGIQAITEAIRQLLKN